jgi:hypothetical protein
MEKVRNAQFSMVNGQVTMKDNLDHCYLNFFPILHRRYIFFPIKKPVALSPC